MTSDLEEERLRARIRYLEGKCAFITRQLEDALSTMMTPYADQLDELIRLRRENQELRKELGASRNSIMWRIKNAIGFLNVRRVYHFVMRRL